MRLPRLFLAALISAVLTAFASANAPREVVSGIITVAQGRLSGIKGEDPTITVFKGIPFAAPPIGDLRWHPPQPPARWDGVRKADTFGPSAMQADQRSFGPWTEEYMFRNHTSEDCLTLNIWTPAKHSTERRAVFVWIHGGAYSSGSGEVLLYDGEGLAKKGIVVVTINYRLGVFGFLAHPELTAESPHRASGNYGLMDQIAALRWVRENITSFGGDPNRITVAGQSAGAGSVHHLLVSPEARGLFHRAIAQSGPWRRNATSLPLSEAEDQGRTFARSISAPSLAELRALSAEELFSRYQDQPTRFRPIVDGWIVPNQVLATHQRGEQIDVPLLTGWTADESSSQKGYGVTTVAQFTAEATKNYGERAVDFTLLYPVSNDAAAGEAQKQSRRDAARADLYQWTTLRAQKGRAKDWGYFFERAIPWPAHPEYGAFHSGELPYTFNNLHLMNRPWQDIDHRLADQVSSYWVNFVENGDPNGPGLPSWPEDNNQLLRFGATTAPEPVLSSEKRAFYLE